MIRTIFSLAMGLTLIAFAWPGFAENGGDAAEGRKLFNQVCFACHGLDGVGQMGLGPSVRNQDFLALASDDFIRKTIIQGRLESGMPPMPHLKGEQIENIIAFLRSLKVVLPRPVQVDDTVRFSGDAAHGSELYGAYCSSCHGPQGEGYVKGGSGPAIGRKGFLSIASDDYIMQTLKRGRVGTAMRRFIGPLGLANLSEQDGKDIIAHLRTLGR